MMTKRKQRMSMREAMDFVDDDMPDGAYWALAHEIAGLDYGDGFDELIEDALPPDPKPRKKRKRRSNAR